MYKIRLYVTDFKISLKDHSECHFVGKLPSAEGDPAITQEKTNVKLCMRVQNVSGPLSI